MKKFEGCLAAAVVLAVILAMCLVVNDYVKRQRMLGKSYIHIPTGDVVTALSIVERSSPRLVLVSRPDGTTMHVLLTDLITSEARDDRR